MVRKLALSPFVCKFVYHSKISEPMNNLYIIMLRLIPVYLVLFCCVESAASGINRDSINFSLKQLDFIISNPILADREIRTELDSKKQIYKDARSLPDQYNALRDLFNLYRTYKIDSALIVADKRLEVARNMGIKSKIASASLNLADGYTKSGNIEKALMIIDTLDKNTLEPHQIKYLNGIIKIAYSNKLSSSLLPSDRMLAMQQLKQLRDKELMEVEKDSRGFLVLQAEQLREAGLYNEAVAKMEEVRNKFDINDNAALLFEMGETYLDAGKQDEALFYLAKAASLDLSNGTKEYKALILLASVLFDMGQVERSFAFINRALEDAEFSNAQIRTEEINRIMPKIYKAFADKEREIKRRTAWFVSAIGILNLIMVVLIILLFKAHKARKKMINEIREFNDYLSSQNRRLEESDKLKMLHLKRFMMAYASHISHLKGFRKSIYRLLKTDQFAKAIQKAKTEKEESPDNSAFQEMFDNAFLSMFPNFVIHLNKYLKQPLDDNEPEKLTPEIRIAALMKLDITSTQEISEMFQYSAQSVYNLRSTLRSMINVPWEEFEQKIKEL